MLPGVRRNAVAGLAHAYAIDCAVVAAGVQCCAFAVASGQV